MTMKTFALAAAAACAATASLAGEFSKVVCDASALPPERRFVAELLTSRVEARTPPSDAAQTLSVRFALDAAVAGEDAAITVDGGTATIAAGRFRGLVFGAGELLRRIKYGRNRFSIGNGTFAFAPKKPLRLMYFARHFHNWYHHSTAEDLCEYIDDLALSGHNAFLYQYAYPTFNRAEADDAELRRYAAVSRKAYERIHAIDCEFVLPGGDNQAPKDTPEKFRGEPNVVWGRGNAGFNVCPAKPGAMEFLLEYRRKMLAETADTKADYFSYWPYDEGGCNCAKCRPWGGNGFLKLIERFTPLNKEASPNAKLIISTWVFDDEDWAGLYRWIEANGLDGYLLADSHGDFPKYPLEHPVPRNVPVITFPEISMWGRRSWGEYGAIAMPKRFFRLFHQANRISSGFRVYSEGRYEDINKEVVVGLYIDPSASVEDILRSYASYYMPGTDPEDFVKLCALFEDNHEFPGHKVTPDFRDIPEDSAELAGYRRRAAEACRIADRMQSMILPTFRQSWRWRLVFLRAMIDREIFAERVSVVHRRHPHGGPIPDAKPATAKPYFDEVHEIYKGCFW